MKGWGFSWRATWAWAAGALSVGVLYGLLLVATDVITDPSDLEDLAGEIAAVFGGGFVVFLILGGFFELVASIGWRLIGAWPRPWLEMALCAAVWFAFTHWWGVDISFDDEGGLTGVQIPLAFFAQHVAPVLAGALGPFVYWRIARPKRD